MCCERVFFFFQTKQILIVLYLEGKKNTNYKIPVQKTEGRADYFPPGQTPLCHRKMFNTTYVDVQPTGETDNNVLIDSNRGNTFH